MIATGGTDFCSFTDDASTCAAGKACGDTTGS